MRIRDFASTLNFAIATLQEDRDDDNVNFEKNFNPIMRQAANYIRKIIQKNSIESDITESEINRLVIEDYNRIIDETYKNTDIPSLSAKYLAVKYLAGHRNEIPELLKEIQEKGVTSSEDEPYSDDFHRNLLLALLDIQEDYNQYYENMKETNPDFWAEIESLIAETGKNDAFKKFCEKYSKMGGVSFNAKRQILSYGYLAIFGIEGLDEKTVSENSAVMKYKTSNYLKDYVNTYLERIEPIYRDNLKESILSNFRQLEEFGEIDKDISWHNEKMRRIGLPGLGYATNENDKQLPGISLPKIQDVMNENVLSTLDIDVLLRMNSFYNNRLAKVINDYAMAIFVIDNLKCVQDMYNGKIPRRVTISENTLEQLMIKYKTLILPIKAFYAKTQREIEENREQFDENVKNINGNDDILNGKSQVVLNINDFIEDVESSWKQEYERYFDGVLPDANTNNLRKDILLVNTLYNPVFLSYRFKNMALNAEYAYLQHLSQKTNGKALNFGIVLKKEDDWKKRTILLASDGGVNLSNKLHTIKDGFSDFLVAQTSRPLARIYEGFEDFSVGKEFISSKLLLPISKQHTKYLKDLKRGKLASKGDTVSRITPENEALIDHINYCTDREKFMKAHSVAVTRVDKKGNVITEYKQPIRYIDLTNGIIYNQREDGKLVDKNGIVYGEERENIER